MVPLEWPDPHGWARSSVQFSHSVVSDSLRPHGLQHARLPCPSPPPGAHSNSCPSRWWLERSKGEAIHVDSQSLVSLREWYHGSEPGDWGTDGRWPRGTAEGCRGLFERTWARISSDTSVSCFQKSESLRPSDVKQIRSPKKRFIQKRSWRVRHPQKHC